MDQQDRRGETLTREALDDLDIPLAPGAIAPAGGRGVATETSSVISSVADAGEATERLAAMDLPADVVAAMAAATAAIPAVQDDISDQQAMRFVTARRLGAEGRTADFVQGVVDDEPRPPQTLPAVLASSVFAKDPNWKPEIRDVQVKWMTVYDLPGYMREGIRALGRTTFRTFACFDHHARVAAAAGEDPLGSIKVLASIQGQGPSLASELNVMARWIRNNGVVVDVAQLTFPIAIPGYEPRIILSATDSETFLMVEERRDAGAPCDALYVYSWVGGRGYYLGGDGRLDRLAGLAAGEVAVPRQAVRRLPSPSASSPATSEPASPKALPASPLRRARISRLQEAPSYAESLAVTLRREGFRPANPATPMVLRRQLEDERVIEATISADGAEASVTVFRGSGDVEAEHTIASIADLEGLYSAPAPTP